MRRNCLAFLIALAGTAAAQTSSPVRIYTVPDGRIYSVDGVFTSAPTAAMWLAGTRHTLTTDQGQDLGSAKTIFTFRGWMYTGGALSTNTSVTVTADPAVKEIYASYDTQHALTLSISGCQPGVDCASPGTVTVNGVDYSKDTDIFLAQSSTVVLTAAPAPGYAFLGWQPGSNQQINGFTNTVTMKAPTVVHPIFKSARRVNLATDPAGLDVYVDRARTATPASVDWAYGTDHTLGVPSPQADLFGHWWIFSRWSDGAAENRTVTTPDGRTPLTYTAVFVPGTMTDIRTSPAGLSLIVDGRDNWTSYEFPWGAGETHRLEAPAQQTDAKGRLWQFSGWSNGGARSQQYVVPTGEMYTSVRLTATYAPVGHLTVTSAVSGLVVKVDGADCPMPCDVQRPAGTAVKLSAPASLATGEGSRADFDGWPGSGSYAPEWSLTLNGDPVNMALTYRPMNRLRAAADPADAATWRFDPASADGFYDASATVTVTAVAQPGFRFRRWSGDASGSASAVSVAMNAPRLLQAMMERIPYITPSGVSNAAGTSPESGVAPGSIVSIFGASLASDTASAPDGSVAQALGCVTVRAGGRLLPLFFVSPAQINFWLPDDTVLGEQRLTLSCQGLPDAEATFQVARNAPGLFDGAVAHADGSAVTANAPARPGELLTVYGTGFGPASAFRPFGLATSDASPLLDPVTVQAGDAAIAPERAYSVAGRIGVDAVQFRAPDAVTGPIDVRVTVNGKTSNPVKVVF